MNKFFLITLIFCIISLKSNCQVAIGSASTGVDENVVLDLTNTSNRGLLLPFSSIINSPEGNLFFNSSEKMLGIVLDDLQNSNSINYLSPWKYSGNSIVSLINSIKVGIGNTSPSTNLHIIETSNASSTSSGGALQIGWGSGQHIVFDSTKIISKSNNNAESVLQLQGTGHVKIGNHYSSNPDEPLSVGLNGPVPSGGIIMWSGPSDDVPDGWVVCDGRARGDGTNTPNLSGRFVVGIGSNGDNNYISGEKGGKDSIQLTLNEMPSHDHGTTTGIEGSHEHIFKDRFYIEGFNAINNSATNQHHSGWNYGDVVGEDGGSWSSGKKHGNQHNDDDNDTYLYTYDKTDSGNPNGLSSGKNFRDGTALNTHSNSANHSHDIYPQGSGDWFTNRPKYYALCFIMKK